MPIQIELAGSVQAVEHATISARVAGQIVKLPVQIGSKVKKGDLLVKISAAEINARVQQAETQLAQAQRNLARESQAARGQCVNPDKVKTLKELVQTSEAGYREAQTIPRLYGNQGAHLQAQSPTSWSRSVTWQQLERRSLKLENGTALEVVIQVPEAESHYINS